MSSLVIMPTCNEAANIKNLTEKILCSQADLEILIIDDNSPDGTGKIADQLAKLHREVSVIHRSKKLGLGSAYVEGFRVALKRKVDFVIEMDADFSHDPADISRFLKEIQSYDLVIGSRYLQGSRILNWPVRRLVLSKGATLYTRFLTGLPLTDATTGFKCISRSVLEAMDLDRIQSNGYAFQIEVNYWAYKHGFRIGEIPIVFSDRSQGSSKMSINEILEAIWIVWKLRFGV